MTLVEAVVSLGLHLLVVGLLGHTVAASATALTEALSVHRSTILVRHVEHLLDRTLARAGRGGFVAVLSDDRVTIDCDADGNGSIDARSTERATFALAPSDTGQRLVHWIGRQPMTLVEGIGPTERMGFASTPPGPRGRRLLLVRLPLPEAPIRAAISVAS
jgi:hypothetical protein